MTRRLAAGSLLALSLTATGFAAHAARSGPGTSKTESRRVESFDAVAVHAGIHATITIGDPFVEVKADDDILPKVRTEVKDGVLEIGFEREKGIFGNLWNDARVEVRVRTPKLAAVHASGGADAKVEASTGSKLTLGASGGGHVTIDRATGRELRVEASGGGTVEAAGLDAADLQAHGSGGGVIKLVGRAAVVELEFSGGAVIKGRDLAVEKATVRGSGGGSAHLKTAEVVQGSLSGGSTLHVGGNPQAKVRTSGGGEIVYEDGGRKGRGRHDDED